jgi:hypothetical protein
VLYLRVLKPHAARSVHLLLFIWLDDTMRFRFFKPSGYYFHSVSAAWGIRYLSKAVKSDEGFQLTI